MFGELLDLITSRQYIIHFFLATQFQAKPKAIHEKDVKRIFRHLMGTKDYSLWYKIGGNFLLKVFIDADQIGCVDDSRSTSGGALFLGDRLVPWLNKKQDSMSLSNVKVECIIVKYHSIFRYYG